MEDQEQLEVSSGFLLKLVTLYSNLRLQAKTFPLLHYCSHNAHESGITVIFHLERPQGVDWHLKDQNGQPCLEEI